MTSLMMFLQDAGAITGEHLVDAARYLGAGMAMGFGAIGPGIGEGMAAGAALQGIAANPKEQGVLVRTMFIGQAVAESTGIYALVIAIILLFVMGS
jgi:F-type H+-transporting ATPase subunit c